MNLKVLGLLGLAAVAVLALAVPTVAFSGGGEDELEPLALQPHDGPNGEYATVVDGEIELAFDRLSKQSTTTFDDVFSMTATADEPIEVWIEFEGAEVYADGDPDARIDAAEDALTLQPGDAVNVGVRIETDDDSPDTDRMTIHAVESDEEPTPTPTPEPTPTPTPTETPEPTPSPVESQFEVVEVTTAERITAGELTTIDVTVENVGNTDGEYTTGLLVDGVAVDTRSVTIPAGERRTVSFERTFGESGTFDVGAGDVIAEVEVESTEEESSIEVTDVRIEASTLGVGDSTEIVATVENLGDADGAEDVELTVGGIVVETKVVEVPAGESRAVAFERQFTNPGVYAITVNGVNAGDVVVDSTAGEVRQLVVSIQSATLPLSLAGLLVILVLRRRIGVRPFARA